MSSSSRSPRPERARAAAAALAVTAMVAAADESLASGTPEHVRKYVEAPKVAGQGKLTWFGFHVYDAQLFVPGSRFDAANWPSQPFVLELTYARKLEGQAIAQTSVEEMQRMGLGTPQQHARWLEAMRKLFPDVDKGRRIAGVNVPGTGARFYVDGRFAGSVDEPEFARAFFAIWLDERTRAPKLRDSLLAAAAGSS